MSRSRAHLALDGSGALKTSDNHSVVFTSDNALFFGNFRAANHSGGIFGRVDSVLWQMGRIIGELVEYLVVGLRSNMRVDVLVRLTERNA